MGVEDTAAKFLEARIVRIIRGGEVTGGDDHVIEDFRILAVIRGVTRGDLELAVSGFPHVADAVVEADPVADARLLHPALDIVEQHFARRVGGDLFAEMFLKGIVGEFQTFFRAIRPEVAIHRPVVREAALVRASAPGIVPEAAPVRLRLIADDLRDIRALRLGGLEGAQLREA